MPILDVYESNIAIIYKTTLVSKTAFFVLLTSVISLILPLIFAYSTRGFWLKHDTFYEQPQINFKGKYLIIGITSNSNNIIICNNINFIEEFEKYEACATIKQKEFDYNSDKIPEELFFEAQINLEENEILKEISIVLPLDFRLTTECPLQMETAVIFQQKFQERTNSLNVVSNLILTQTFPLPCHKNRKNLLYNTPIINNRTDLRNYEIKTIIDEYYKRNISTHLDQIYTTQNYEHDNTFVVDLKIKFPQQRIYYTPNFWQVIKWALIQYVPIYLIIAYFIARINNYMFKNNLLLAYKSNPYKTK